MKKIIYLCICILFLMPTIIAPGTEKYDGVFSGGIGNIYKSDGRWQYKYIFYLTGQYKDGLNDKLDGSIYNLNENKMGTIHIYINHKIILGYFEGSRGLKLLIIGTVLWNDTEGFAGQVVGLIRPMSYIYGWYIKNK